MKPKKISINARHPEHQIILWALIIKHHFPDHAHLFNIYRNGNIINFECPNHELADKLYDILHGPIPPKLLKEAAKTIHPKGFNLIH